MENRKENVESDHRASIYHFLYSKDWSPFLQMAGLTFMLLTIQIWQLRGYGRLSLASFFTGVICLYRSSSIAIRFRQNLQPHYQMNTAFLLLLESMSLFYVFCNHGVIVESIGTNREFVIILGLLTVIVVQAWQLFFTVKKWKPSKTTVIEILLIGALCLVFGFLLNLECFDTWPRWDDYNYFADLEKRTARNIFFAGKDSLKVCSHVSTAFTLWSIFFRIIPGLSHLNAIYLSNMILVVIDLAALYLIFKRLLPKNGLLGNALFATVVICSPWIFGSVANINAEHLLVTGVLLLIYAMFSDNGLLGVFSVFVVCTTRETGPMVAAMIIAVKLLYTFIRSHETFKPRAAQLGFYFFSLCIGALWLVQYGVSNFASTMSVRTNVPHMVDGKSFFQFGISALHIKDALISCFISSFNWVFSTLVVCATGVFLVTCIKGKQRLSYLIRRSDFLIIVVGLLVFVAEVCGYITYNFSRYYALASVLLCILGLCGLHYLLASSRKSLINYGTTIIIGALLLTQSYVTVDPVTAMIYPSIDTGKISLALPPQHSDIDIDPSFTDAAYSNRQIMYFDKTMDKAYAAIYNSNAVDSTKVLLSDEYVARHQAGGGKKLLGSLFCVWGYGYSYLDPPMWGEWNSEGGYRYLSYDPETIIDPSYVLAGTDLGDYLSDYEHVYYIKMPWGDTVLEKLQARYPDIDFYQTVEYHGWVFDLYRVK